MRHYKKWRALGGLTGVGRTALYPSLRVTSMSCVANRPSSVLWHTEGVVRVTKEEFRDEGLRVLAIPTGGK